MREILPSLRSLWPSFVLYLLLSHCVLYSKASNVIDFRDIMERLKGPAGKVPDTSTLGRVFHQLPEQMALQIGSLRSSAQLPNSDSGEEGTKSATESVTTLAGSDHYPVFRGGHAPLACFSSNDHCGDGSGIYPVSDTRPSYARRDMPTTADPKKPDDVNYITAERRGSSPTPVVELRLPSSLPATTGDNYGQSSSFVDKSSSVSKSPTTDPRVDCPTMPGDHYYGAGPSVVPSEKAQRSLSATGLKDDVRPNSPSAKNSSHHKTSAISAALDRHPSFKMSGVNKVFVRITVGPGSMVVQRIAKDIDELNARLEGAELCEVEKSPFKWCMANFNAYNVFRERICAPWAFEYNRRDLNFNEISLREIPMPFIPGFIRYSLNNLPHHGVLVVVHEISDHGTVKAMCSELATSWTCESPSSNIEKFRSKVPFSNAKSPAQLSVALPGPVNIRGRSARSASNHKRGGHCV